MVNLVGRKLPQNARQKMTFAKLRCTEEAHRHQIGAKLGAPSPIAKLAGPFQNSKQTFIRRFPILSRQLPASLLLSLSVMSGINYSKVSAFKMCVRFDPWVRRQFAMVSNRTLENHEHLSKPDPLP
jgi:hypothetical protein